MTPKEWHAIHKSLRAFCPCPNCGGQGWFESPETQGHMELCGECHGTCTTEQITLWVQELEPGAEAAEPLPRSTGSPES